MLNILALTFGGAAAASAIMLLPDSRPRGDDPETES
jgi:hypothetical protein